MLPCIKTWWFHSVAVPDLEKIVKEYLYYLNQVLIDLLDNILEANYDWMKLEMYDQTVRNHTGGEMAKYLHQDIIINEDFIYNRIGEEGKYLRKRFLNDVKTENHCQ